MNKIITTITNTLEGWTIEEYHDPILAKLVVGFNESNDVASSLLKTYFVNPFNKKCFRQN